MTLQKQKKIAIALLTMAFLILPLVMVFAQGNLKNAGVGKDGNLKKFGGEAGFGTTEDKADIDVVVGNIIKYFLSFLGVIFLGLLIYGGFEWMQARGDSEAVTKAKDTMFNAIIGLAIVLGAYMITGWIVGKLAETTLS